VTAVEAIELARRLGRQSTVPAPPGITDRPGSPNRESSGEPDLPPPPTDGNHRYEAGSRDVPRVSSLTSLLSPPADSPVLDANARHGLAGEMLRAVAPHTEAHEAHLLTHLLATFGAAVGRGPHVLAGNVPHPGRLFIANVGNSAKARKGTAGAAIRPMFEVADPAFMEQRVVSGFGSGEALIDMVQDSDDGKPAPDQRLLVREGELARVLRVCTREGSTLSMTVRDAWDGSRLSVRSRGATSIATGHHIVIVGDITVTELRMRLTESESANGFANRFLFALGHRARLLPDGGNVPKQVVNSLGRQIQDALQASRKIERLERSPEAADLWRDIYYEMANDDPDGLLGSVVARGDAQLLRISVLYALLDGEPVIRPEHLLAARDVWAYCRMSAQVIFGDTVGDEIADRILRLIRRGDADGTDRTAITKALSGHVKKPQLDAALELLVERDLIGEWTEKTGGRDRCVYVAKEAKQAKEGFAA
jgi:hypothetical protein